MSKEVIYFPENKYVVQTSEGSSGQSPLKKALGSFESRLGVSYKDLTNSKVAQKIARKNLDKETIRLREKYLK